MSGILGIWNMDGEPVQKDVLASMSARMAHRGLDGESILINGNAGFAFQMQKITPESLSEKQPVVSTSGCVLLFDGRLDNRKDLIAQLPASEFVNAQSPDSSLALAAYSQFGEKFIHRLDGEFALALFNPDERKMFLARDTMATRPLYFCRFGDHVLFATEIKALLAHPVVKTAPNRSALAEYLFRAFDYGNETATFFENISVVPPSHVVHITENGVRIERFWDFDMSRQVRCKSTNEYIELYRHCFENAVRKHLRTIHPVAVTVSGGLDSSSIFCLAQELYLREPGISETLGFGFVPDSPETNELVFQQSIEEKYEIEIVKLPLNTTSIGAVPRQTWNMEGPFQQWEAWHELYSQAQAKGCRVICSGFFGDQILQNPQYILDLIFGFRWITARKHLRGYYGWYGDKHPKLLYTKDLLAGFKGFLIPEVLRPLYQEYKRKFVMKPLDTPAYSPAFLQVAFRGELSARALRLPSGSAHAKVIYSQARSKNHALRMIFESNFTAMMQMETGYPFRDRDLISLLMALPGEVVNLNGVPRGLHRAALEGVLPKLIKERVGKADFSELANTGARNDLDVWGGQIASGSASRLGFLKQGTELQDDIGLMRKGLDSASTNVLGWCSGDILALDSWLQSFFSGNTN